jgi:hypothetical protein
MDTSDVSVFPVLYLGSTTSLPSIGEEAKPGRHWQIRSAAGLKSMDTMSRYWWLVRLDASGKKIVEEIVSAKAFFQQQFPVVDQSLALTDSQIQQHLMTLVGNRSQPTPRDNTTPSTLAELCLRCFISHQIEQTCLQLESKFGQEHGFTRHDLFPFVLDDVGPERSSAFPKRRQSSYPSLATEVLRTFESNRASLSTWVGRLVKNCPELNVFLLEHGVYLVSDWAILNDTSAKQLRRILTEFYHRTEPEIQRAIALLESHHVVYRRDRLQQRQAGSLGRCPPPTLEQQQQMAARLSQATTTVISSEEMMAQLQDLAQQLRRYRIVARSGVWPMDSLDVPETLLAAERQALVAAVEEEGTEQLEFLSAYRQQFIGCLDQALAQVTHHRLHLLQQKSPERATQFLTALHLFHCQGAAMAEIAPRVSLQAQYQVSRLLQLKEFRADVRREMLQSIRAWTIEQSKRYANSAQLDRLDAQVDAALDEQITSLFAAATAEASVPKNRPADSLFAQRLCYHLNHRNHYNGRP